MVYGQSGDKLHADITKMATMNQNVDNQNGEMQHQNGNSSAISNFSPLRGLALL